MISILDLIKTIDILKIYLFDQNLTFRDPNNGMIKEIPISSVTSNSRTTTFNVIKHKDFKRIVTIYSGPYLLAM